MATSLNKECRKCGEEKSLEDGFHKDSTRKDGYHPYCKSCRKKRRRERYQENPEKELKVNKLWRENNPEKAKKAQEKFEKENPDYYRNYHRKWKRKKYKNDPNFRLKCIIRTRINSALRGKYKNESSIDLLGCTVEQLREHLESQFEDGMTWDNHGEWHIDHIKPFDSFNLSNPEELQEVAHYENLQPLWKQENLRKSNKTNKGD